MTINIYLDVEGYQYTTKDKLHNSMTDCKVIRACHEKLMSTA